MILTGSEIKKMVSSGDIVIQPFYENLINPNSYNYRLGENLIEISDKCIDTKLISKTREIKIPDTGYVLQPGKIYLGVTLEIIGSSKFVTSLIGRSSLGRLGLFLQITADLGHLGTRHQWTLELKCVQPLKVYPFMKIGQVSFWKPDGIGILKENYSQKENSYSNFSFPQTTIISKFI